ncbi:MAG: hypothetical protein KDI09_00015 [Halioglobus sp.]|nr:hypothetical protein [Halioglobus sp.]
MAQNLPAREGGFSAYYLLRVMAMKGMCLLSLRMLSMCALLVGFNPGAQAIPIDTVNFTANVIDSGIPSTFAFSVTKPVPSLVGQFFSTLTLSGTLTDARGDGVALDLGTFPAIAQATINGVDVFNLGPVSAMAGAYGPFSFSTLIDAANFGGAIDHIGLNISFLGSGDNDQYAITAMHSIEALLPSDVSLPGTIILFAVALSGLALSRGRTGSVCS